MFGIPLVPEAPPIPGIPHRGDVELKLGVGSVFPQKIDYINKVVSGEATDLSINLGQVTIIYLWIFGNSVC